MLLWWDRKILSPQGASILFRNLLSSYQIRCLWVARTPLSPCVFYTSQTQRQPVISLAKTLRAGPTEGLMLCKKDYFSERNIPLGGLQGGHIGIIIST